jgi:hypothetical protein
MEKTKPLISIFCGSRIGNDLELLDFAYQFGKTISKKYGLIYGGTNIGLMNSFANGVLDSNGEILGVITEKFKNEGIMHNGVENMIITSNMHERKKIIYDLADIFIIFPGGLGTLDETFEVLTWKQLNIIDKPIFIFNYKGFFNDLFNFLDNINNYGFIDKNANELYSVHNNYKDIISAIDLIAIK